MVSLIQRGPARLSDEPDALLHPRKMSWMKNTAMHHMTNTYNEINTLYPTFNIDNHKNIQKRLQTVIRADRDDALTPLILRRFKKIFSGEVLDDSVQHTMNNIAQATGCLPDDVTLSTLRLVCNGMCTSERFQEEIIKPCRLCGLPGGDAQQHYIRCQCLRDFAGAHLPILSEWMAETRANHRSFLSCPMQPSLIIAACTLNDCLVQAIRGARRANDPVRGQDLPHGRLRALSRRCSSVNSLVRER